MLFQLYCKCFRLGNFSYFHQCRIRMFMFKETALLTFATGLPQSFVGDLPVVDGPGPLVLGTGLSSLEGCFLFLVLSRVPQLAIVCSSFSGSSAFGSSVTHLDTTIHISYLLIIDLTQLFLFYLFLHFTV